MPGATLTESRTMAKTKRNDVPAKVDADVIRDAKTVAAYLRKDLNEYLTDVLRPIVARDLDAMTEDIDRRKKQAASAPEAPASSEPTPDKKPRKKS